MEDYLIGLDEVISDADELWLPGDCGGDLAGPFASDEERIQALSDRIKGYCGGGARTQAEGGVPPSGGRETVGSVDRS